MSISARHLIVKEDDKIVEKDIDIDTNDDIPEGVEINFLSKDEIANDLVDRVLSGEDKASIKTQTAENQNGLSSSLGSFIRNTYGLWLMPHPYASRHSSADNDVEKISLEIIEMIQKRLAK